jgi:anti-sigma factor RsiW
MPAVELTCREFVAFLSEYVEGGLDPDEAARFEAHLAECPDCVAYLESFRETIHLGRECFAEGAEPPEGAPEELVAAILAARGSRPG